MAGRAEAGGSAGRFGEGVDFFKGGLQTLDNAELGDAMAWSDGVRFGREIGEDDAELAAVARVDDPGEGGDAAEREAGAIFDEGSVSFGQFEGETGADGLGGSGLACGSELDGFGGEEIRGEIAEWPEVGVAGQLCGGVEALDADADGRGFRGGVGHGRARVVWSLAAYRVLPGLWPGASRRWPLTSDVVHGTLL